MKKLIFSMVLLVAGVASAQVKTERVEYRHGGAVLEGLVSYDDAVQGKRPGVLVVHEWYGVNDFVKGEAEKLAAMGYVAFAADIYGKGVRPKNNEEAGKQATFFKSDRQLLRGRAAAGLKALLRNKNVDESRVAAIGYCFGGTTVLELARAGADLDGVVSFHGGLNTPTPEDASKIKGKVLALHGADDPNVPPAEVQGFIEEMRKGKVDWQLVSYGGAVHAFTNPAAGNDPSKGAAYNKSAADRSWVAMKSFFDEIFKATR